MNRLFYPTAAPPPPAIRLYVLAAHLVASVVLGPSAGLAVFINRISRPQLAGAGLGSDDAHTG